MTAITERQTLGPDGMEAGFIAGPAGKLFACYHPPRPGIQRDCAVLLCDPFGSDRMNLHLSYRALALRLADVGFAALRVDYPGTCDSSGYPRDLEVPGAWLASLRAAADWLQRRSGATQLGLFGALLGGTLAMAAASARDGVAGLMLWGALPSGAVFLREAGAMQALMPSNPRGKTASTFRPGDREAVGFLITQGAAQALAGLDTAALSGPFAGQAAVFHRGKAALGDALARRLEASGSQVYVQRSPIVEIATLVDRQARPPEALLDEMVQWWSATFPQVAAATPAETPGPARLLPQALIAAPGGAPVQEELVRFGADRGLLGIVSEPPGGAQTDTAILFVNGGSNHRAGINRNQVEWARSWAARGRLVLRMDMRGLGDSVPLRPEHICVTHRDESRIDLRDGLDYLGQRFGARRVICIGLCAGAYQALHLALEDSRVAGLMLLNPLRFQGPRASFPGFREIDSPPIGQRARAALDPAKWAAVLRGGRDLRTVSRRVALELRSDARARVRRLRARVRGESPPPVSWIAGVFQELTQRGCDVQLVLNAGDAGVRVLDTELGAARAALLATSRFGIELISDTDHIFSPLWSQERLTQILDRTLDRWMAKR